jgi:hypothetical protein
MTRILRNRRRSVVLACAVAMCGCSPSQGRDWYGYYYENVMINAAPAISRPFSSPQACLAAMRAYTRNASRWAGFACARGCVHQQNGFLSDCAQVVH